jgi:DNA repair exonuclease SbcCD nuclease subunit
VLYPGSIERTSIAEIGEPKGFMVVDVDACAGGARVRWQFRHLRARPMIRQELTADGMNENTLVAALRAVIAGAPADAVLSIRVAGRLTEAHWRCLSAAHLRAFVPRTMNVEIRPVDVRPLGRQSMPGAAEAEPVAQLELL